MNRRLAIIFLFIVLAPLAALGWLGLRVARDEQEMVEHRYRGVVEERLRDVDRQVRQRMEARSRELAEQLRLAATPEAIRELVRRDGGVLNGFLLAPDGKILYPVPGQLVRIGERDFLTRTEDLWQLRSAVADAGSQGSREGNWLFSPAADGFLLLFWLRQPSGQVAGVELSRHRLTADLISLLPSTGEVSGRQSQPGVMRAHLRDPQNNAVYQWGHFQPKENAVPVASLPLSPPLSAWKLEYYEPPAAAGALKSTAMLPPLFAAAAFLAVVGGLSVYYFRENARQMRLAEQRVSFVNHVSHELKTPLTNIRMYAEILQERLDPDDERALRSAAVIVSEGQRLSRLIANVLTFSRHQREALSVHPVEAVVDEVVAGVLESFRPALEARGFRMELKWGAPDPCLFDRNLLEQVVGNLVSNVEKYAADGELLRVCTIQHDGRATVEVTDAGPGVPSGMEHRIFEPFVRGGDQITEGVSGTGIGLTIARQLARLHGGDLLLLPAAAGTRGARFQLTIRVEKP